MPLVATTLAPGPARFLGWRVVAAAFVVAVFGWGVSFYGPPVFLHALHQQRGFSLPLVSAAITAHFLVGAGFVAGLAALHRRFGLPAVTRAAALATALGFLGWALADQPWQLFAAAPLTAFGWAGTGGAAINAMVAPWFIRRRPAALSMAYNGASIGGVVFSPLWVLLIAWLGYAPAVLAVSLAMVPLLWWLAGRYFAAGPAALGLAPDGEAPPPAPASTPAAPPLPGAALWRNRRFVTLAAASSLGLFAQIGLIAHLFSLLVPALGAPLAGMVAGLATVCAIVGRTAMGWLLPAGADRRRAAAANYAMQACGSLVLLAAGGAVVPLLVLGVVLFGLGLGNATSLPPLMAQQDFTPAETARVVALVTACSQAAYAFAPAAFGLLRQAEAGAAPGLFIAAAGAQLLAAAMVLAGRPGSGLSRPRAPARRTRSA